MALTPTERVILESQHTILHGLRILLAVTRAPDHQFTSMQDGMEHIERHLRANEEKSRGG